MMMSNNGTQMVGAQRELLRMIEGQDIEKLREYWLIKTWNGDSQPRQPHTRMVALKYW